MKIGFWRTAMFKRESKGRPERQKRTDYKRREIKRVSKKEDFVNTVICRQEVQ